MINIFGNFKRSEFACKCGCGFSSVDIELLIILNDIRVYFNKPTSLNCACRCKKHNKDVGGATHSYHLRGMAADVVVKDIEPVSLYNYLVSKYKNKYGFILYNSFVHVDVRDVKYRKVK